MEGLEGGMSTPCVAALYAPTVAWLRNTQTDIIRRTDTINGTRRSNTRNAVKAFR